MTPQPVRIFEPSLTKIDDGLFMGDEETGADIDTIQKNNITSVVSMTNGTYALWSRVRYRILVPKARHLFIACLDTSTQDLLVRMAEICDFIDKQLAMPPIPKPLLPPLPQETEPHDSEPPKSAPEPEEQEEGTDIPPQVLVHCSRGISRSATAVIAYLMRKYHRSLDDVMSDVKGKRKIKPNPNFMEQLRVWEETRYEIWEDKEKSVPKEPYRVYLEGRALRLKAKGLTGNEPTWPVF